MALGSGFLFLEPSFLRYQGSHQLFSVSEGGNSVTLSLFPDRNQAFSPLKAPFGSFSFEGNPDPALVRQVLKKVESWVMEKRISVVTLVLPPDGYRPEIHLWLKPLLTSEGFHAAWQDLNFHLDLSTPFVSGLHRSERWKLNKLRRDGFEFQEISEPDWDFAYPFFLESRTRKGYTLSMGKEDLQEVCFHFPDHFGLFGVFKDERCAALGLSIRVSQKIEYLFYTADDLQFRKWSPVVLLHAGLAEKAAQNKVQLLDLGTASLKGIVNNGVATFKRNLGATASLKDTLIRKFAP